MWNCSISLTLQRTNNHKNILAITNVKKYNNNNTATQHTPYIYIYISFISFKSLHIDVCENEQQYDGEKVLNCLMHIPNVKSESVHQNKQQKNKKNNLKLFVVRQNEYSRLCLTVAEKKIRVFFVIFIWIFIAWWKICRCSP